MFISEVHWKGIRRNFAKQYMELLNIPGTSKAQIYLSDCGFDHKCIVSQWIIFPRVSNKNFQRKVKILKWNSKYAVTLYFFKSRVND